MLGFLSVHMLRFSSAIRQTFSTFHVRFIKIINIDDKATNVFVIKILQTFQTLITAMQSSSVTLVLLSVLLINLFLTRSTIERLASGFVGEPF